MADIVQAKKPEARLQIVSKPKPKSSNSIENQNGGPFKGSEGKYKDIDGDNNLPKGKYPPIFRSDGQRVYRVGEKGSGLTTAGKIQDFQKIRRKCIEKKILYEDPNFPADDSSLFFTKPQRQYKWLRPTEIVKNPKLFVKGVSRFDVQQGELGDCWLLAAVANLTLHEKLFFHIVPNDQSFDEDYAGVFHFRFWQYDKWVDVVIDDRLPTCNGYLIFLHSSDENEFWSALLEKAYAKLHGSYEALKEGSACEAMEDFTGGLTEMFQMKETPSNLYSILLHGYQRCSLMGCSVESQELESRLECGLIGGHAYSITKVCHVDIDMPKKKGRIPLLRVRNPWGNESEWTGAWSDESREWKFIPDSEKDRIGLNFDRDGEFWMSYEDFSTHFSKLEICNLDPDSLDPNASPEGCTKVWETNVFHGDWVRGVTAGGRRRELQTYWQNPQYEIILEDPDDDDELCTVVIALMQKNRRSLKSVGMKFLYISFEIYQQGPNDPKPLTVEYFKYHGPVARYPIFTNSREVSYRFKLPPGKYCIVPCTYDPNEEGKFLLRVFTGKVCVANEYDEEIGFTDIDDEYKCASDLPPEFMEIICKRHAEYSGPNGEVGWSKIKEVFSEAFKTNFSSDLCRSLVAMMDADDSGELGLEEYKMLACSVIKWMLVFELFKPENNRIHTSFLREAFRKAGYTLNNRVLNILALRYATEDDFIELNDFVMCAVRLNTMIDSFIEKMDTPNSKTATFTLEEWLRWTMYS